MQIKNSDMNDFANLVADIVLEKLKSANRIKDNNKTAYAKTETLLYNYNNFKKIITKRELEIDTIRKYGVPQKSTSIVGFTPKTNTPPSVTLEEDAVECAIRTVQDSMVDTVQVIGMIDKAMDSLRNDPYYHILEMLYFEGRTQEDIATYFGVTQVTISKNKSRLVRELSLELFPNQAILEML